MALGELISIRTDLRRLLRKHFKTLRLVLKKATHKNGHLVQTHEIIDYLLTKKRKGRYLLLRNFNEHCIAIDANLGIIMESYQEFPEVEKLNKGGFKALDVNPQKLSELWQLERKID